MSAQRPFWDPDSEIVYSTCNPNKPNYAYNFTLSAKSQWDKCQQKSNNCLLLFIPCSNYLPVLTPPSILFWQIPDLQQIPTQEKEHHMDVSLLLTWRNKSGESWARPTLPRCPMALENPESINTNTCQQLNDLVWTGFRVFWGSVYKGTSNDSKLSKLIFHHFFRQIWCLGHCNPTNRFTESRKPMRIHPVSFLCDQLQFKGT